jgi:hypothetical protein
LIDSGQERDVDQALLAESLFGGVVELCAYTVLAAKLSGIALSNSFRLG